MALRALFDGMFAPVAAHLRRKLAGPSRFSLFISLVRDYLEKSFQGEAFTRVQDVCAPNRTPFSQFFIAFPYTNAGQIVEGRNLSPSVDIAIELVLMQSGYQYLALKSTLYPGVLAQAEKKPFASLEQIITQHLR